VDCYISYSKKGTAQPPLAVPNVTAHPSTASVPVTVLLYNGPLLCGFNVPIKGLNIELLKEKNSECSSWIKWWESAVMSVLLTVLGWRDQCQLLYHKWWCASSSWWNTQSLAASCRFRDAWLDSVNINLLSRSYCTIDILHYVGFCLLQFVSPFVCLSVTRW